MSELLFNGPSTANSHNIWTWTGQSMLSLLCIADDRGRWAVIEADGADGGVPQRRLGVTGIS